MRFNSVIENLKNNFQTVKITYENPGLLIFNKFAALKNEIDIECELLLQSHLMSHEQVNMIIKKQIVMIEKLKEFEQECLANLSNYQSDIDFINELESSINEIQSRLETQEIWNDKLVNDTDEMINGIHISIQKKVFLNRGIIFVNQNTKWLKRIYKSNRSVFSDQSIGCLIIIEDEFVSDKDPVEIYSGRKTFDKEDLKAYMVRGIVQEYLKSPLNCFCIKINLKMRARSECNLKYKQHLELFGANPMLLRNSKFNSNLFQDLRKLTHIALNGNEIESIHPDIFTNLFYLKRIDLSDNYIKSLNERIFEGLSDLESINLINNRIGKIHNDTFKGLSRLKFLKLRSNNLAELNSRVLRDLKALEQLDLQFNKLKTLDETIFQNLLSLKSIYLGNNMINYLDSRLLDGLVNLKIIDLSDNLLEDFDKDFFKGLTDLQCIFARRNKFNSIDSKLFEGLNELNTIDFDMNIKSQIKFAK